MNTWRLLDPGPLPAWRQMALDAVVIRARAEHRVPDTIRFMEFEPHAALLGYHQALDLEVYADVCADLGVEVNRRITGGGAIYMDSRQLGWEICLSSQSSTLPAEPMQIYQKFASVVVETLAHFGIEAAFRPVNDVEVCGRKISGTGGTQWGDAWIYQGTLLIDFDVDTMLRVLRLPIEKLTDKEVSSFRQRTVTVRELLRGAVPPISEVKAVMVNALQKVLGVQVQPATLTPGEQEEWVRTQDDYRHMEWINRRRPPALGQDVLVGATKAQGGLLKASLVVDKGAQRIRRAFLSGDFFVYPERAVMDMEASLKEAPADPRLLRLLVQDHYEKGNRYVGVEIEDWMRVFELALSQQHASV
ncbi:lipoate--protein ligase family protein [Alicyclobacillus tolerans]|uniref:lipoate--protein ligase family protein n=1 Tax=Alicyclobacillus tolerans TaxID=90970 RepID=UPI001F2255A3|nr:lipoate--protein ligase family protein [Alicyclobacillus tolerans]MCF8563639.1 lipoate--protein ligase family protein [Alicyclobacillus tolerans]